MHTTGKEELVTEPTPVRSPHCTLEQARELVEGPRAAYQSLQPAEQIMIRSMIAESAQPQFAQETKEHNEEAAAC
jgi:hypothetical protein